VARTRTVVFLAALVFFVNEAATQGSESDALPPGLKEFVETWLYRDCGIDNDSLAVVLVQQEATLEPVFWEAFAQGPPQARLRADSVATQDLHARRNRWLREFGDATLGEATAARLLDLPVDSLIAEQRQIAVRNYKENALIGLGYTGGRDTESRLELIGHDMTSPYRRTAEHALRRLRDRLGP
jgi:hypothetical protein